MKKNWTKVALALGPAIIIASYAWQYASTNGKYTYVVTPWSIRGYDTIHGEIFVVMAVLLLIGGMLTATERSMTSKGSALVVGYVILASSGFAFYYVTESLTITVAPPVSVILSILLAGAIALPLRSMFGESVVIVKRALPVFVLLFLFFFFLFGAVLVDKPINIEAGFLTLIVLSALGAVSMAAKPVTMGASRMIILSGVLVSFVILLSAGAIRQTLVNIQLATPQASGVDGIAAAYKDTHASGGWWLTGLGALVFFIGAVGLWARRRDIVAAIARAQKQRAAAEKSAQEIRDAADAYAKEHEGTSSHL